MKVYTPVYSCAKVVFCLVLLIILAGSLTADEMYLDKDTITVKISLQEPGIQFFRYQSDGEQAST